MLICAIQQVKSEKQIQQVSQKREVLYSRGLTNTNQVFSFWLIYFTQNNSSIWLKYFEVS